MKVPQRKPNKWQSGKELLNKAVTGLPKPKTELEIKTQEIHNILYAKKKSKTG